MAAVVMIVCKRCLDYYYMINVYLFGASTFWDHFKKCFFVFLLNKILGKAISNGKPMAQHMQTHTNT